MATYAYALRIDSHLPSVKTWAESQGYGGFAVREVAAREHWHFLLTTCKTIKQVRSSFARCCPELIGNKGYSLTTVKELEKYIRYLCKGDSEGVTPEVAWTSGLTWTDEKFEEEHEAYWSANKKMKKAKTSGSMIDWVIDECKRLEVRWEQREVIAKIYIRELGARSRPVNMFSIRSGLNSIQIALCPDDTAIDLLCGHCAAY